MPRVDSDASSHVPSRHPTRREALRAAALLGGWTCLGGARVLAADGGAGASNDNRRDVIAAARPLRGGPLPADLPRRLATAHVSGRYHFTDKPFLIEGAERVRALGLGGIKLWFYNIERAYGFNSRWNLRRGTRLVELARHPYFVAAFALPFSVIALELYEAGERSARKPKGHMIDPASDFREDEEQVHELSAHLLEAYRDRDVTFLLQNWEGDWMFRGGTNSRWLEGEYPELDRRVDAFVRWFDARQRGVERARAAARAGTRCRVFHTVEVNRVFDLLAGHPTVTTHVLPHVRPDFISWSCYDGLRAERRKGDETALGLWEGLDLIQRHARTTQVDFAGKPAVYIGEMGFAEQLVPADAVVDMMDGAMGTLLARRIPYLFHWELFCNERRDGAQVPSGRVETAESLRGFWLVRPDGTLGHTGNYLQSLIAHAGGRLPR